MTRLSTVMLVTALALLLGQDMAAEGGKCGVQVIYRGRDGVGQRFALVFKERITASSRYRLVEENEGGAAVQIA
jgi:hypothetical protein